MATMANEPSDRSAALTLAVAGFLDSCRSAHTRAAYGTDLAQFATWCASGEALNLLTVDAGDIARYRTACEVGGLSSATIARRLSTIMSFRAYAAEEGLQPALAADASIARPSVAAQSTAEMLSDDDAMALLDAADRIGKRSAVLIRLLMLDGLKVGEVVRADASDVRGQLPRTSLDVRGRTSPTIVLHTDTGRAVRRYLGRRSDGPLLLSKRRGQRPGRLTRFGVDYLIKEVASNAGIDPTISGNTLRRRYVIAAHTSGTGLDRIRHNTGHANERTTRRYLDPDHKTTRPDRVPTSSWP
jgi:integrase/recombinase XerD